MRDAVVLRFPRGARAFLDCPYKIYSIFLTSYVIIEISISDCKTITDEGLAALTSVKNLRRLECKNLYQITDDPLISIVEQCSFLEILNVEGCTKLTDELTRALCHAPRNSCAKKITINYSQCYGITDESLKVLESPILWPGSWLLSDFCSPFCSSSRNTVQVYGI